MKKNRKYSRDIEILKERQNLRILEQELKIKFTFKELSDYLTGKAIMNRLQENRSGGSGLAIKLGIIAASLLMERFKSKRKK